MLLIILCVGLLPFGFASINTTCLSADEGNALNEIGRKLGKDWDFEGRLCCDWEYPSNDTYENNVRCNCDRSNSTTCNVIAVSLKGQSLQGILPLEFVNLRFLEIIDLTRNYLSGTIPPQWGSMEHLRNISLIGNRLNGSIPKELGNISTLQTLTVEDNMMSGIIPEELGNLSSIERLFFNSNFFTGELPASFAKLTTMKEFRIGGNNFSGKIPDFIGQWRSLESLRIQASGLEGPIPSNITLLESLTDLRISDLRGRDTPIPPISSTTRFKNLILRSCNLIGQLPESLAPQNLKVLDFSFNKLNGSIPPGFAELNRTDFIYLTGNLLSGRVPNWMLTIGDDIDLSYNKFTYNCPPSCHERETNLFASSSDDTISNKVLCLRNSDCPTYWSSLHINCGGKELSVGDDSYERDMQSGGPSYFDSTGSRWGFSNTGHFMDDDNRDSYIVDNTSRLLMNNTQLYMQARASALSLTYYGFCLLSGSYTVSLHFAEISFTDDETYNSLGRRVFDIYIQGNLVEKDFDISERAGGVGKAIVIPYPANVTNALEIRLYWAGKGTINIPFRGTYGPLISAVSVDPNFPVPKDGNGVSGGTVAGIVVGTLCLIILILGVLWWRGFLRCRDSTELELNGLELNTGSYTLRQIKTATNNFDVANKIGEGGFGPVYKGVLQDGTLIAVKQLSSKSKQGNREFLNELGVISALQHPHLVKLHGCCIEGNQLLLAYEYMENNSLARALFGPKEWKLELDWPTRYRICIQIAKGLAFLHEESRLKIVHRDIKATNVLLDKNLNAKISDFGLARLDEEDNTHISTRVAGTYGYMAPEYALRGYLTDKADVYSYGIVLLEIVSGRGNIADKAKENQFVLLDQAISLKTYGNLMELVDPKLDSKYDIQEMTVVINLALACTAVSPANRPTMSSAVSMLEGRIVPQDFSFEQSRSMTEIDREKMMKQLENTNESHIEEMSIPYTDSSTSAVDLYPVDGFSDYLQNRSSDTNKLLS
ncbi:putative transferase, protein kinase RLK-Pelle-DLSV family [Helianthus annuus]|uniref:probable leucine-rich repeat receptor-like serine/threonine-protein kinase At3g14840 n=1 Tax=Helianthus annuus TaxID=4232 RepID=UPI000B8FD4C7|nr:probable leucine-rich repeat receptor-like serine/threonine-protein kinase At3g14840 [Helianthus annuus]KAJ0508020.1 putative transferase, protein kinase RLK-Pelle-DLSV family [Helianthus annuus]KAJ0516361.1 putative transferase, protein kinase RLK-Pelle-DLSV family [Helianthus annuus]KAJ0684377.1 putative transferase, protein kinase RLK-Pelle-DLSV family [Helianthus annuus]